MQRSITDLRGERVAQLDSLGLAQLKRCAVRQVDIHLGLKPEDSYRVQDASVGSCFTSRRRVLTPGLTWPPQADPACPAGFGWSFAPGFNPSPKMF